MYKMRDTQGHAQVLAEATKRPPFGPGLPAEELAGASRMEVWGSSFSDPGEDFCEFRVFDDADQPVATGRVAGY